jgi:hypothetical protein
VEAVNCGSGSGIGRIRIKTFGVTPTEPGTTKAGTTKPVATKAGTTFLECDKAKNDQAWNEPKITSKFKLTSYDSKTEETHKYWIKKFCSTSLKL